MLNYLFRFCANTSWYESVEDGTHWPTIWTNTTLADAGDSIAPRRELV